MITIKISTIVILMGISFIIPFIVMIVSETKELLKNYKTTKTKRHRKSVRLKVDENEMNKLQNQLARIYIFEKVKNEKLAFVEKEDRDKFLKYKYKSIVDVLNEREKMICELFDD